MHLRKRVVHHQRTSDTLFDVVVGEVVGDVAARGRSRCRGRQSWRLMALAGHSVGNGNSPRVDMEHVVPGGGGLLRQHGRTRPRWCILDV